MKVEAGQVWEFAGAGLGSLYLVARVIDEEAVLLLSLESGKASEYPTDSLRGNSAFWRRIA